MVTLVQSAAVRLISGEMRYDRRKLRSQCHIEVTDVECDEMGRVKRTSNVVPQEPRPQPPPTPTPQPPNPNHGVGPDACEAYRRAGRSDLAAICRMFGNGPRRNRFRHCLQFSFYAPRNGRGGYIDSPAFGILGPLVGPGVHLGCLDYAF